MISLIRNLDSNQFAPIVFVHADTDTKSPVYLAESKVVVFYVFHVARSHIFRSVYSSKSRSGPILFHIHFYDSFGVVPESTSCS